VHQLLHVDIHSLPPVPEMIQIMSMGSQGHHSYDCRVSVKTNTKEKVAGCVHDVPDAENCKGAKVLIFLCQCAQLIVVQFPVPYFLGFTG
jgi:hypothetical protein